MHATSVARAARYGAAVLRQARHASIPKAKGGMPGRNMNVHYKVYSQMRMAPETKGLRSTKVPQDLIDPHKDRLDLEDEALERATPDGYEKFPWKAYGRALATTAITSVIALLAVLYAFKLRMELETVRYQHSVTQGRVKQLTTLSRKYQEQIDSYRRAFDMQNAAPEVVAAAAAATEAPVAAAS